MRKNEDIRLKGQLRLYLQWPTIMIFILVVMTGFIYKTNHRAGWVMAIFLLIYIVLVAIMHFYTKSMLMKELVEFAAQYGIVQNTLLKELTVPYAILADDGKLLWMNDAFEKVIGEKIKPRSYLSRYIPELNRGIFPKEEDQTVEMEVYHGKNEYRAEIRKVSVEGMNDGENLLELPREHFFAVHLHDTTELNRYIKQNEDQRLVAGLIYIDNYEEVIESVEEVRQSLLVALIDRKINQYISKLEGIVKKMETDKYFVVIKKQSLKKIEEDRFSLLEDVKGINIGNTIPATLSVGLGLSKDAYSQSYNYARVAIDLALARGGDQAVIKNCNGITYYGGKREQTSKNTRVKARVKAEALREFITVKDHVLVMGHTMTDLDSFGAAIGIYRAATALQKKAHIVINDVSASIRTLYEDFAENSAYPDDLFVTSAEAKEIAEKNALIVVVDTNRPKMTECPELLKMNKTLVVLDHHRQSSDKIENAVLSYIEPYASSACEMVSEILQYIVDDIKIPAKEASSLYAGIMIDTNNFMNKAGVRTFEAAAFLRRCGADIPYVRKIFRDDMESYRAKASIISAAEVYHDQYAIAKGQGLNIESPTIIGAQAANELLDINKIKASFVLTPYNGKTYVSARSIDEVNVQVIMEKLGGGGHMNASGAQFDHTDLDEGVRAIKRVLDEMIEKGDLK